MLNKKLLLIYCLFIVHLLSAQTKGQAYRPQYSKQWKEVTNYIHHDWVKQRSVSNNLPYAYITAWAGLPFMFYWDTYFINEGLLMNKLDSFAKNNIDNLLYAVDKFGYVGNAVMTDWGMNRSQPPYLSSMVRSVYERSVNKDTVFLRQAYNSLKTEYLFWTDTSANAIEQHNTSIKGLQRFYHHASSKELIILYGELAKRFNLPGDIQDNEKAKIATLYAVEAETGMDFTPRFEHRCPDFIAVELNSLLYVYEINFAWMVKTLQFKNEPDWNSMAMQRKELINEYCWDEKRGLYLDYDYLNKRGSKVAAATTFQLLWTDMASKEQAKRLVKNLPLFETKWGIATVEKCGEIKNYQWGETSVWAPMQVIVAEGLDKYGYKTEAKRIASKFLDIVTKNFIAPVPETFKSDRKNIARKSGSTYEKYKTNGTINDDEYPASEMMGWTAGCFLWCYNYVTK
jgi:alpha,alpha-trehalase